MKICMYQQMLDIGTILLIYIGISSTVSYWSGSNTQCTTVLCTVLHYKTLLQYYTEYPSSTHCTAETHVLLQ